MAVDLLAVRQPGGAETLKAVVEQASGVAEQLITGVAEGQHCEAEVVQTGRVVGADRLPEQGGVVRELAITEGRGHRDEVRDVPQGFERNLVELGLGRRDADGGGGFGELHGDVLGAAHIAAVTDHQRELGLIRHWRTLTQANRNLG